MTTTTTRTATITTTTPPRENKQKKMENKQKKIEAIAKRKFGSWSKKKPKRKFNNQPKWEKEDKNGKQQSTTKPLMMEK